jgi:hypothetical protein
MTDEQRLPRRLDDELDRIAEEVGIFEETTPEELTYELGSRFGARLRDLLPLEQPVYDDLAKSALESFAELFPADPDPDTVAFQAFQFAPAVAVFLTGRGLSTPEIALVAGVDPAQLYRIQRRGLSLIYKPADPKVRTGVHREYSGVDHRKSRLTVDYQGLLTKQWPEPLAPIQPFLLGIIDGGKSCLSDPWVRNEVESGFKAAIGKALTDPILGEIFDGIVRAALRITQGLRDSHLLLTQAEISRAQAFQDVVVDVTGHKDELLDTLRKAGREIAKGGTPLMLAPPKTSSPLA